MSVIINLSIFPVDKGESLSQYVVRAVNIIKDSGLSYKLGAMGTSIEGEWDQIMAVVRSCFDELKKDCSRVYMNITVDYRKGGVNRIEGKVRSVEKKQTV